MKENYERAFLCESSAQVSRLAATYSFSSRDLWLATTPDAGWELKKRAFPYRYLEDFEPEGLEGLTEDLLVKQIHWANNIDLKLRSAIPEFQIMEFRPTRYCLYHLKNTWDTLLYRAALLSGLWQTENFRKIIYVGEDTPVLDENLGFQSSALAQLVPLWAKTVNIEAVRHLPIPGDTFWAFQDPVPSGFRHVVYSLVGKRRFWSLRNKANDFRRGVFGLMNVPSTKAPVIVKEGYDLTPEVCAGLMKRGHNVVIWSKVAKEIREEISAVPSLREGIKRVFDDFINNGTLEIPHVGLLWPWEEAMGPIVRAFFSEMLPRFYNQTYAAETLFRKTRPLILTAWAVTDVTDLAMVIAGRRFGVPSVIYQHGGAMGEVVNPLWDVLDGFLADVELVWGEGEKFFLEGRPLYGAPRPRIVCVGSARLEAFETHKKDNRLRRIRKRLAGDPPKPLILYVPNGFFSNFFRFTNAGFREGKIFRLRCRLAELFKGHPECRFIYKRFFSQGRDPTEEMLNEVCPEVECISSPALIDLMSVADAVIQEAPGTAFMEGLSCHLPTLVYANSKTWRFRQEAIDLLPNNCFLYETEEAFLKGVQNFLDGKVWKKSKEDNNAFTKVFLGRDQDIPAHVRATDALEMIIKQKSVVV